MNPIKVGALVTLGCLVFVASVAIITYSFMLHWAFGIVVSCIGIGAMVGGIWGLLDRYA